MPQSGVPVLGFFSSFGILKKSLLLSATNSSHKKTPAADPLCVSWCVVCLVVYMFEVCQYVIDH